MFAQRANRRQACPGASCPSSLSSSYRLECNHAHLGCKLWTILWAKYKSACHTSCVPQSGPTEQIELMANRVFAAHRNPKMDTMRQLRKSTEETVRDIRRATRWHSAQETIRIILEGPHGQDSIAEISRNEGIAQNLYCRWSNGDLEAGKKRFAGDTAREATSDEVKTLRAQARQPKEATFDNQLLKKA